MTIAQEYYGFTPNKYVTSAAAGGGVGSVEDPWTLDEAMTSAVAGDIVGIAPGVYVGISTDTRYLSAFRPSNSGTSGNPIRFVARWAAAAHTSDLTDIRCGNTNPSNQGCSAFGTWDQDYIEWVGILSDHNDSNNLVYAPNSCVGVWSGDYVKVYGCKLIGNTSQPVSDNYCGIRHEVGDYCEMHNNIISGFSAPAGPNKAGFITYKNQFTKIYNNEIFDCNHAIQPKGSSTLPIIGLEIYKNKVYNCGHFIRQHSPTKGPLGELNKVYQNIVYDCTNIFEFTTSDGVMQSNGMRIFNNVFYNTSSYKGVAWAAADWRVSGEVPRDNEFFNNIISSDTESSTYLGGDGTISDLAYYFGIINPDRNVVHNVGKILHAEVGANLDGTTWSEWQTAGADVNSTQSDPLFTNPSIQDFTIGAGSSALSLGRDRESQFGTTDATIPAGVYVTGSEVIGLSTSSINQPPAAFTATAVSLDQITLTWTPEAGSLIDIERSLDNATWTRACHCPSNDGSYKLFSHEPSTLYYYRARHYSGAGVASAYSSTTSATTLAAGTTYYVRKDGNDSNAGTTDTAGGAFLTIQRGVSSLTAGDILNVRAGTYSDDGGAGPYSPPDTIVGWLDAEPPSSNVCVNNNGTAESPIIIQAVPGDEGSVVIDAQGNKLGIHLQNSDYIHIRGFRIINSRTIGVASWGQPQNNVADESLLSIGVVIENNSIINTTGQEGKNTSAIGMWGTKDWIVRNNSIDGVSAEGGTLASGMQSYGVINALVEHNDIKNIDFGIFWKDHFIADANRTPIFESEIRYNLIESRDRGIYLGIKGTDTVESGVNYIHHNIVYGFGNSAAGIHVSMSGAFAQSSQIVIEHNTLDGEDNPSSGISADSTDDLQITGNIILRTSLLLELINYDPNSIKRVALSESNYNVYDASGFQIYADRYFSSGGSLINNLAAWQTLVESDLVSLDVSNPDQDSITVNATSLFLSDVDDGYRLAEGSSATGLMADGSDAGAYQFGVENIGLFVEESSVVSGSTINQLPAANYTPAKFSMEAVSPRPDAESDLSGGAYYRYYHASMPYKARVAVRGGAWPLHYDLTTAPAGATIGNNYGDADYGVISWASPTGASETFTVTVTDQEGNTPLVVTWTATLDESKFVFVNADVAGPSTGTFADPLSDIDAILSGHANKIAVLRGSASQYAPTTDLAVGNTTYPSTLMGFPGESPIVDGAGGRVSVNDDDTSVINLIFDGSESPITGPNHAIFRNVGDRFLLWNCTFRNQDVGTGNTGFGNPACFVTPDVGPSVHTYIAVVDCTQEASSMTAFAVLFTTESVLIENNFLGDSDLSAIPVQPSNADIKIHVKDDSSKVSVRANNIIAPSHNGKVIAVFQQGNDVNTTDQEVCWNTIVATSTYSSGLIDWNGQEGENTVVPNMYQYRNSIKAVNGGYCCSYNYFPTGAAPANPAYAVTVEDELWSNNGPSQYIIILNGVANNDGTVDTDLKYTFGAVVPVILDSSTEVDANGLLTGAARTTYLGTVGAEVAGNDIVGPTGPSIVLESKTLNLYYQGNNTWKTYDAPNTSKIFQLAFDGNTPLYTTPETAYEGNGYISFYGDGNGNGTLGSSTNFDVVDILDDPLYGTVKGLRDTYYSSGTPVYSFTNQTANISHNPTKTFHMRMRIKWSGNWEWGNDQLKFCKNTGTNGLSVNLPKFDGDGDAYSTIFPADLEADAHISAVQKETLSDYRLADDIVNDFGGSGVDANWSPTLGQWYTLDWFSDAGTFGNSDGSVKIWVDGNLYLQSENLDMNVTFSSGLYSVHELGHVWQNGAPTQDIFMEWHDIQVFDIEQTPGY